MTPWRQSLIETKSVEVSDAGVEALRTRVDA